VPIAFHVDYWDYLGWQDKFAKPEHRVRQEDYAAVNKQSTIYTPAFFVNGKPWQRGWFNRQPEFESPTVGVLQLKIDGQQLVANFQTELQPEHGWKLHVVILGLGLTSDIAAGENSGRHSAHEFVVLNSQSAKSQDGQWQLQLSNASLIPAGQYALAAWVTTASSPRPVQAVGGYLPALSRASY
jgi:hypothetical protein